MSEIRLPPKHYVSAGGGYAEVGPGHVFERIPVIRKDGKYGKRWESRILSCTHLKECDLCGKVSTPKKVFSRADCSYCEPARLDIRTLKKRRRENKWKIRDIFYPVLCWGCRNKIYPLINEYHRLDEIMKLTRTLQKVSRNAKV